MILSTPSKGYAKGVVSKCESCHLSIDTDSHCYHCPKGCLFDCCSDCVTNGYSLSNPCPIKRDTFIVTDHDISIILSYWYRICIINPSENDKMTNNNVISLKQNNLPLQIIELQILPYLYSKKKFKYHITVGVISLDENDTQITQSFIKNYIGWRYSNIKTNIAKGRKIGIYDNIDVEFIELKIQRYECGVVGVQLPKRVGSLEDISVVFILYNENINMIKQILEQLMKRSNAMYIAMCSYGASARRVVKSTDKSSATQPNSMKMKLNQITSDLLVSQKKKIDKNRIAIMEDVASMNRKDIKQMINNTIFQYIRHIERLYKAF